MAADWDRWRDRLTAELWEAVALSLDLEPKTLMELSAPPSRIPTRDIFGECPPAFRTRLEIAIDHAANSPALPLLWGPVDAMVTFDSTVSLKAFADWAQGLGWALPTQFYSTLHTELTVPTAPGLAPANVRRGPKPGGGQYVSADQKLFPDIAALIRDGMTLHGAVTQIADRIKGTGSRESHISRVERRYRDKKGNEGR